MSRYLRLLSWICASLLPLVLMGCELGGGPMIAPVNGVVLYQGKPVEGAVVQFMQEGSPVIATGTTAVDGAFKLSSYTPNDGAPVGAHRVIISKPLPMPQSKELEEMVKQQERGATSEQIQEKLDNAKANGIVRANIVAKAGHFKKSLLPPGYSDVNTSPLTATVKQGEANEFEFSLTD